MKAHEGYRRRCERPERVRNARTFRITANLISIITTGVTKVWQQQSGARRTTKWVS